MSSKKVLNSRTNVLVVIVLLIFTAFIARLVQFQVVDGDEYYEMSNSVVLVNQNIEASRGDIVDTNGEYIATTHPVFNVTLNSVYFDFAEVNQRLFEVLEILNMQGEEINDLLPLSYTTPYTFNENQDSEIGRLKNHLDLNVYATEENVMDRLIERYQLEEFSESYQRQIAGLRYTMEREGFSSAYPFSIAKNVSEETATIISEYSRELPGVELIQSSDRYYEEGTLIPHLLGTLGPIYAEEYAELKEQGYKMNDIIGKNGLEKTYENYLKGEDGSVQIEKNKNGTILNQTVTLEPEPGDTVRLTIHNDFQLAVNDIAQAQMEYLQAREAGWGKETSGVSIVVLDVETGGILASSTYPSYDLNDYYDKYTEYLNDELNPLFNRAIQGTYRPGSVFKMVVAAAGLQEGLITEHSTYHCKGYYDYYTVEEWGGSLPSCAGGTAHGVINVEQALQVSCNVFFYDLGRQLGIDTINEMSESFGLGVATGIETGESLGVLSSPEYREEIGLEWNAGDVIQVSIGQLDTQVTTLQLATYANTIANDGARLQTHIVEAIETFDGEEIVFETPVNQIDKIEDNANIFDTLEDGMVLASSTGNAGILLRDLPYSVATKTGTAQVSGDLYNATMVAYGPVENPKIAIAVIGEKAGNGYNLAFAVNEIFLAYDSIMAGGTYSILEPTEEEIATELDAETEEVVNEVD